MLDGGQFVEALGRLGYPAASSLRGSEFDWLFDCPPENVPFLRFVCRSLGRDNVLSPEEVRAFRALRDSGKPLLDESALGEVLKTCGARDGGGGDALSSSPFLSAEGEVSVEDLEAELRCLQKEKQLKQQRLRKLQVLATSSADAALRAAARQESASRRLTDATAATGAENAGTNAALQTLTDEVRKLGWFLRIDPEPKTQGGGEGVARTPARAPGPPVLLSQLSLEPYLQQEERSSQALAALIQRQFSQGGSDLGDASRAQRFQLPDLSSCREAEEDGDMVAREVCERGREELARLQWAHVVAQHQLLKARADERGARAGLQWLSEKPRCHAQGLSSSRSPPAWEAAHQRELQALEAELEALFRGPVPACLREGARLLTVPVVRGDLALQQARLDTYPSRQAQVRDQLLRQKASLELLRLAQDAEQRRAGQALSQLGVVASRLRTGAQETGLRIQALAQPHLAQPHLAAGHRPSPVISAQDAALSRLLQILEPGRAGPFRTHADLDRCARSLRAELRAARQALAGAARQQDYTAARLHGDCEALRRATYSGLQQLVLGPHVSPTASADQELCPNAQELTAKLSEVEAQLNALYRVMQGLMTDVSSKRSQLERSSLLRQERGLYVLFHLDARLLRRLVEDLEAKTAAGKALAPPPS